MSKSKSELNAQLTELLQEVTPNQREIIATITLITYDCELAELLLRHFSSSLNLQLCDLLREMLNFRALMENDSMKEQEKFQDLMGQLMRPTSAH